MSNVFAWFCLIFAIITEVAGITAMKLSNGFTLLIPSIYIFVFYSLSLSFLFLALKSLPIGFTYAIWSGLGTLLIFGIGIVFFHEPITVIKTMSVIFIIVGVTGLRAQ